MERSCLKTYINTAKTKQSNKGVCRFSENCVLFHTTFTSVDSGIFEGNGGVMESQAWPGYPNISTYGACPELRRNRKDRVAMYLSGPGSSDQSSLPSAQMSVGQDGVG